MSRRWRTRSARRSWTADRGGQGPVRPRADRGRRLAAAEAGHFDIGSADVGVAGRVQVDGDVDLADALDLEAAVAADAHHQLLLGSTESLDVRRSIAVGNLARAQAHPRPHRRAPDDQRPRRKREVVLHVHLEHAAVLGAGGLARLQETGGPVTAAQVREWCANPDAQITVQPVLDLAEHLHVGSYEASARLKLQTQLRDAPAPSRSASAPPSVRLRTPRPGRPRPDDGGPTCTCNHAPCCRRHHRAKTTGGWTYLTVEPGVYLWRSPLGYQFLRDHTGTLDVTPDPERRRLARTFTTHFGSTQPDPEP